MQWIHPKTKEESTMATTSPNLPTPEQIAVAQWRFGLIAPVIQNTYQEVSEMAYYRRITEQPLTHPDGSEVQLKPNTLQKWTSEYRRYGFEALIPKERESYALWVGE